MNCEKIALHEQGSADYAQLQLYLLDDTEEIAIRKREIVVICPGGGYEFTSDREAEMIALQFAAKGIHAAVLRYSVSPAVRPTAMLELGRSVALVREKAAEWHVDPAKVTVMGFSAGGHLAADYCVSVGKGFLEETLGVTSEALRPDSLLLCYPVITSGEHAHRGSIAHLLGKAYDELTEEEKDSVSIEKQVSAQMPPTFIWHTFEDESVPIQNSCLLFSELVRLQVPVEYHVFRKGSHGLALANETTAHPLGNTIEPSCQPWIDLAITWLKGL